MELPRVRFTVRQMMVAVVAVALVLGILIARTRFIDQYLSTEVERYVPEALEARTNLHFSIFTLQLVERFVSERGRWPRSWSDLDGVPMREGPFGRKWPAASTDLQRHISIDFVLDPYDVARQDPMNFGAIRSIGPYYEYGDVAYVESLQRAIRRSIPQSNHGSSSNPSK